MPCLVMSIGPPSQVVLGWGVPNPKGRSPTKACQRLRETCTDVQRLIATVSAAPAEHNMQSTVRSRLKHIVMRAEVFRDRLGARVCLRLPLAAR